MIPTDKNEIIVISAFCAPETSKSPNDPKTGESVSPESLVYFLNAVTPWRHSEITLRRCRKHSHSALSKQSPTEPIDGRTRARLIATFAKGKRIKLAALGGVMNHGDETALANGHVERLEYLFRTEMVAMAQPTMRQLKVSRTTASRGRPPG